MLRVADLVPVAAGVNVTLAVQLAPAARLDPHVFVWAKSDAFVPEKVKLVIAIATELPFVIVTVWAALFAPTFVDGNVSEAGETVIAAMPVPESGIVCGLPVALSVMVTDALRAPIPAGSKVTVMVQVPLLFTLVPQVLVCVKSPGLVPVTAIEVNVSLVVAELVRVTDCEALGFR
jgi:hypothetical protein